MWVKPDGNQADTADVDNSILTKWRAQNGYPYAVRYYNQTHADHGKIVVARYDGTTLANIVSSQRLDDGTFHHITFVKKDGTLYLYIDGKLDGVTPDTAAGNTSNNSHVLLGNEGMAIINLAVSLMR